MGVLMKMNRNIIFGTLLGVALFGVAIILDVFSNNAIATENEKTNFIDRGKITVSKGSGYLYRSYDPEFGVLCYSEHRDMSGDLFSCVKL
jgi:hypothetical protein